MMGPGRAQKHVLIVQPSIQHYRVPVFDRLRAVAAGQLNLEVCGTMNNGEAVGGGRRAYFHDYPLRKVQLMSRRVEWWPRITRKIRTERPDVVIAAVYPSNITSWLLPACCKSVGTVLIGWGKVHSPRTRRISQRIKRWVFNGYNHMVVYGECSREELLSLGYPAANVVVANNTIDTDRIFEGRDHFHAEAERLRRKHGLEDARVLLCVSKMEPQKRHQDLFAAWSELRESHTDLHLVLIGSGSLAREVRQRAECVDPSRIHFLGRVPEGEDYSWIAASDATIQCGAG